MGRVPDSVMVGVGDPVATGVKVLATPSAKPVLAGDVKDGGPPTVRVKAWVPGLPMPLVAVKVMGKVPAWVGVPVSLPPVKLTPVGRVPDSVMVGVGVPLAVGVKLLAAPSVKLALSAEVMAAKLLPAGPGMAVQVYPFGSVPLALKVNCTFQLSVRVPALLAQAMPPSQIPLVSSV